MPTKILAAAANPTAPLTPMARSRTTENARTTRGKTRQYVSTAVSALTTMISGNARNARMKAAPGRDCSNGNGPPPRYPNTNEVPASVACCIDSTTKFTAWKASRTGETWSKTKPSAS